MNDNLYFEVYNRLQEYLANRISLKEFQEWFDRSSWGLYEKAVSQNLSRLAGEIELRLAEFSSGHWTEAELYEQLTTLMPAYATETLHIAEEQTISSGTAADTIRQTVWITPPGWVRDLRLGLVRT